MTAEGTQGHGPTASSDGRPQIMFNEVELFWDHVSAPPNLILNDVSQKHTGLRGTDKTSQSSGVLE